MISFRIGQLEVKMKEMFANQTPCCQNLYIYIYIHTCIYVSMYMYIYTYMYLIYQSTSPSSVTYKQELWISVSAADSFRLQPASFCTSSGVGHPHIGTTLLSLGPCARRRRLRCSLSLPPAPQAILEALNGNFRTGIDMNGHRMSRRLLTIIEIHDISWGMLHW